MDKCMRKWSLIVVLSFLISVAVGCQSQEESNSSVQKFQRKEVAVRDAESPSYGIAVDLLLEEMKNIVAVEDYEQIMISWTPLKEAIGDTLELDEMEGMEDVFEVLVRYPLDAFEDHYMEGQYDVSWAFTIMSSEDYQTLVALAKEVESLEADSYFGSASEVWDDIDALIGKYQVEVDAYFSDEEMPLAASDFYETYAAYNVAYGRFLYSRDAYDYVDEIVNPVSEVDHFIYMYWWDHITNLYPEAYLRYLVGYDLTSDGWGGDFAMVWQDYEDDRKWHLTVDPADAVDRSGEFNFYQMDETLVHEFCHILTLNHTQMMPRMNEQSPTYTTDEGTLRQGSYLNQFYQRFWKDIAAAYLVESDYVDAYADERLYADYPDAFVTEYAATHPAEDIAESFIYFVTLDKPDGTTVKDDKIRFFYVYPELIEIRNQMRQFLEME